MEIEDNDYELKMLDSLETPNGDVHLFASFRGEELDELKTRARMVSIPGSGAPEEVAYHLEWLASEIRELSGPGPEPECNAVRYTDDALP